MSERVIHNDVKKIQVGFEQFQLPCYHRIRITDKMRRLVGSNKLHTYADLG